MPGYSLLHLCSLLSLVLTRAIPFAPLASTPRAIGSHLSTFQESGSTSTSQQLVHNNRFILEIRGGETDGEADDEADDEDLEVGDSEDDDDIEESADEEDDEVEDPDDFDFEFDLDLGFIDVLDKAVTITKEKVIPYSKKVVSVTSEKVIPYSKKVVDATTKQVLPYTQKVLVILARLTKRLARSTSKAVQRAIQAGVAVDESDETDVEEPVRTIRKVIRVMQRAITAALNVDSTSFALGKIGYDGKSAIAHPKTTEMGLIWAESYAVDIDEESRPTVLGGSLRNALEEARSKAQMLVVFIPGEEPGENDKDSKDKAAIASILSEEVKQAANESAIGDTEEFGSFMFWGAKAGSSEASLASKRLKVTDKNRPILMVVYPSKIISSGQAKSVPKVLAQHHCNPPPSDSSMAAWLTSLRKRHVKQYEAMQTEVKEARYYTERKEGFKESQKSDRKRQAVARKEAAKQKAAEKAAKEHEEAIEARRLELQESLPEEATGWSAKKIAIRQEDGSTEQRMFGSDQPVSDIFNWVDVAYEVEREKVELITLNGKQTLTWENDGTKTLYEAGLSRNTGFRVSAIAEAEEGTETTEQGS